MASTSSRNSNDDDMLKMSPETARKLFHNGAVLIVLNLPIESVFGIDMKVYQVAEKFRGVKMIPPGLHYIHYSAVNSEGCIAPRTGFFHFFKAKEIIVKKWNPENEDLNSIEPTDEELQRIRDNIRDLDKNLAPFPYQILKQWNRLTCNITDSLIKRIQPASGIVNSVTQLVPLVYPPPEKIEPDSTSDIKLNQSLEEKYLPNMEKVPGTEIRFTEIPKSKYPEGSTAAEITKHNLDSTYLLEQLLASYEKDDDILGELQIAHICFLVAHVYDAFEHWKKLVHLLCFVDSGIEKHTEILKTFLTILHFQLKEIPTDFFVDIIGDDNFLLNTLQVFFENVKSSNAEENFKKYANNFRKNLTSFYKWDFERIPDEDQPIIVDLDN